MDSLSSAQSALHSLRSSLTSFQNYSLESCLYVAPVLDWHHPRSHRQNGISGLSRFVNGVQKEMEYVDSLANSSHPPTEVNSNHIHLSAVWAEVLGSHRPIVGVCPFMDGSESRTVIDGKCVLSSLSTTPKNNLDSRELLLLPSSSSRLSSSSRPISRGSAPRLLPYPNQQQTKGKPGVTRRRDARKSQIKVDVVCDGGDEWIKVNTIKESRLMAEFREYDSYLNSDFEDSDLDSNSESTESIGRPIPSIPKNDSLEAQHTHSSSHSQAPFHTTVVKQALSLIHAARESRPSNPPRVRLVLTRLSDQAQYTDHRIYVVFEIIRSLGIELAFTHREPVTSVKSFSVGATVPDMVAKDSRSVSIPVKSDGGVDVVQDLESKFGQKGRPLVPTTQIILDLSVVIALCCDSSHFVLPKDEADLEARFRPLIMPDSFSSTITTTDAISTTATPVSNHVDGDETKVSTPSPSSQVELQLAPHTNTSSDLRDQLRAEIARPLILEMKERVGQAISLQKEERCLHRLERIGEGGASAIRDDEEDSELEPQFWVTKEVRERVPDLVDVIGGDLEKARAKALFEPPVKKGGDGSLQEFWKESRWCGDEGVLRNIRVRVIEDAEKAEMGANDVVPRERDASEIEPFDSVLIKVCERMLEEGSLATSTSTRTIETIASTNQTKAPIVPQTVPPITTKSPSGHTIRTLLAGVKRGMTVLTNNRGAVGKIEREIGVGSGNVGSTLTRGLMNQNGPSLRKQGLEWERARIWVVNPSSLSEWRRKQVESENESLKEELKKRLGS